MYYEKHHYHNVSAAQCHCTESNVVGPVMISADWSVLQDGVYFRVRHGGMQLLLVWCDWVPLGCTAVGIHISLAVAAKHSLRDDICHLDVGSGHNH